MYRTKEKICEIYREVDPDMWDENMKPESYQSQVNKFKKLLKEWDKMYVKHIKAVHTEM